MGGVATQAAGQYAATAICIAALQLSTGFPLESILSRWGTEENKLIDNSLGQLLARGVTGRCAP